MRMVELFVPIGGMVMLVVMFSLLTRLIAAAFLNRTIREAMSKDPASVPLLADRLDSRPPWGDALLGWIFIAMAAAMVLLGLTDEDHEERQEILRATIVPVVIGVTVLLYTRFAARSALRP